MTTPRPFLDVPYGAYLAREVPPPDDELTRVGPGTPCGEYLRRFWQPVAFARDLGDVPLRVRIMAEDLVVFRDGSGRVGVLLLFAFCSFAACSRSSMPSPVSSWIPAMSRQMMSPVRIMLGIAITGHDIHVMCPSSAVNSGVPGGLVQPVD